MFTHKTVCEVCDNTLLRHDCRNVLVIGNVKRGIINLHTLGRHALAVPHFGDFLCGALFDVDVGTCWSVHVDGGGGGADVEGDTVVFGEDGDGGGADLVGDIAVGGDAVAADEYGVDPAVFHNGRCHVVAYQCDVHAGGAEFVCGEACALQEWACFVGVDFEVVAFLVSEVHDGGCGAVFSSGKLSGVAVGEESHTGLYEGERVLAYFFADVDVLLLDAEGFVTEKIANFGDGFARCAFDDGFHTVQCPREVDGGGAGGVQIGGGIVKASRKFAVVVGVNFKCGEVDANRCGIADGGCAAHLEVADGRPDFALRFEMEVFGAVREFCLVNDDKGALLFVEGEGFHVEDVCGHCMPPKRSDTSTLPVRPPEWSPARVRGR